MPRATGLLDVEEADGWARPLLNGWHLKGDEQMNDDKIKGKWLEMKGEVLNQWGKLTSDEFDQAEGNLGAIAGIIQQRYGEAKEAISEKLSSMFSSKKEEIEQKFSSKKEEIEQKVADTTSDAKDALRQNDPTDSNLN
jgi:uncharacterized protein YjbJ (UPF0337 family)